MVVRGLLYLIYYSVERWPLRHQASVIQMTKSNSLFFVDYLIHLDKNSILNGEFGSSYWTKLVSRLKNNFSEVTWAHHYIKNSDVPSTKVAAQLLDNCILKCYSIFIQIENLKMSWNGVAAQDLLLIGCWLMALQKTYF
jgi:hypothetical protein